MTEIEVKKLWEEHWARGASIEDNATWVGKRLRKRRLEITFDMLKPLDKNMSVIDLGCGGGRTLSVIRIAGFKNSIGIDYSSEALRRCIEKGYIIGKDVFLVDARNTPYPARHFGLSFSEGLWEHFKTPEPFMDEQMRISDRYLMAIQPDHFSFFGRLLKIGWDLFESKAGGVYEYSYRLEYFQNYLASKGFKMIDKRATQFHEQSVMLFKRVEG